MKNMIHKYILNGLNQIVLLMLSMLIASCGSNEEQESPEIPDQSTNKPQAMVLIYDLSKSVNFYATLDSGHLDSIYYGMGRTGGGTFNGLFVKSDSRKQDPVQISVNAIHLFENNGNNFQRKNIENENRQLLMRFEKGRMNFINTLANKLMMPKNEQFSDVNHAMELAFQILDNPVNSGYRKKVLVISDLENDLPPRHGQDSLRPFNVNANVEVYLVRPSDTIHPEEIFSGARIYTFASISDAIHAMFHNP